MINWKIEPCVFEDEPGVFNSFDKLVEDFYIIDRVRTNWSQVIKYNEIQFYFKYDSRFDNFYVNVPDFNLTATASLGEIKSVKNLAKEFHRVCDLLITQSIHDL